MNLLSATLLLLALGVSSGLAQVTNIWTNTVGGNFSDAANWTNGVVPTSGSNTIILRTTSLSYTNDLTGLLLAGAANSSRIDGTNITLRGNPITFSNSSQVIRLGGTSQVELDLITPAGTFLLNADGVSTYSGVISGSGLVSARQAGNLSRTVLNNNNNSFSGGVSVGTVNHVLQVSSIGNTGQNSAAGSAGAISLNGWKDPGIYTLRLSGSSSASSTDRLVLIGHNDVGASGQTGFIQNNNTNAAHTLTFTRTNFNDVRSVISNNVTLLLGGSNTGLNTIAGRITNNNALSGIALTKTNEGTWVLGGSNSYRGATTVAQGRLIINGNQSAATGAVTVEAGATLAGSGTIGGTTTISGIHSPGNSPGVQTFTNGLTYNTGSSLVWELTTNGVGVRGTDYDGIDVTGGTLDFAGTTTMNLTFNLTNSSVVNWSDAFWGGAYTGTNGWLVYNAASPISNIGNLVLSPTNTWTDSLGVQLTAVRTNSYFTLYQDTINNDIYLNLVPEPSTYALLVLAAAGLGAHVVRRRRQR